MGCMASLDRAGACAVPAAGKVAAKGDLGRTGSKFDVRAAPGMGSSPSSPPDTPGGGGSRRKLGKNPLDMEAAALVGKLRLLEGELAGQDNKNRRLLRAKEEVHAAIGAIGASESLWPETVPEDVRVKAAFTLGKVTLQTAAARLATEVALAIAPYRRHSSFRRRLDAIDESLAFLDTLVERATADNIHKFATWMDTKTRTQREVRTDLRAAEAAMVRPPLLPLAPGSLPPGSLPRSASQP
jgi:hypothetical protein